MWKWSEHSKLLYVQVYFRFQMHNDNNKGGQNYFSKIQKTPILSDLTNNLILKLDCSCFCEIWRRNELRHRVTDYWIEKMACVTREWGKSEIVKDEWKSICRGNHIKAFILQSEQSNMHLFTSLICLSFLSSFHLPFHYPHLIPSFHVFSPAPPLSHFPSASSSQCVIIQSGLM